MFMRMLPAAALLSVAALPAEAMVFHYKTSDLATPAGAEAVFTRISDRAVMSCSGFNNERGLWRREANRECAADLVAAVVAKIGDSGLDAVHAQRREEVLLSSR